MSLLWKLKTKRSKIKNSKIFKVWEASAQVLVVQTVNLTECGELVQDLVSDAKEYDSRSVIIPRWEKWVVFTENCNILH